VGTCAYGHASSSRREGREVVDESELDAEDVEGEQGEEDGDAREEAGENGNENEAEVEAEAVDERDEGEDAEGVDEVAGGRRWWSEWL